MQVIRLNRGVRGRRGLGRAVAARMRAQEARWRAEQGEGPRDEVAGLAASMAASMRPRPSTAAFLIGQMRFAGAWFWAVPAVSAVLFAFAVSSLGAAQSPARAYAVASAAAGCVGMSGLAAAVSGRAHGMAELEGSCAFNAQAVACARLLASFVLALAALVLGAALGSDGVPAAAFLVRSGVPYLVAYAGGLAVARRLPTPDGLAGAIAWAAVSSAAFAGAFSGFADLVAGASDAGWLLALAVSGAWCAREVGSWIESAAAPAPVRGAA